MSTNTTARRVIDAEAARMERTRDNVAATLATRVARADLRINTSAEEMEAFEAFAARFQGCARVNLLLLWDQCPAATRINTRQSWPFDSRGPRRVRRGAASIWQLHIIGDRLRAVEVYDESATVPA